MFRLYRRVTVWIRKREISHIRLRRSHQRYRRLSYRDALTGLHNRRAYENDLTREMQRSERYEHPLTIALLDIDFFKKINDQYGHDAGDRVLKHFAKLIQKNIRDTDSAYRFGGEEFIIILPETNLKAANAVITRIQSSLLEGDNEIPYTFSCGISLHQPKDTAEQLFERADELLYQVKENGRNGIRLQS
nr:GGDEF domain-containing protein [Stutzerimonas stutzeri]